MKRATLVFVLLSTPAAVFAQDRSKDPAPAVVQGESKDMETCKADIRKYCDGANLKQECLVAHWNHISTSCQDTLATPMHAGNGRSGG